MCGPRHERVLRHRLVAPIGSQGRLTGPEGSQHERVQRHRLVAPTGSQSRVAAPQGSQHVGVRRHRLVAPSGSQSKEQEGAQQFKEDPASGTKADRVEEKGAQEGARKEGRCGQTGAPERERAAEGAEEDAPQEEGRSILGTHILGVKEVPDIEQDPHRADRNGKAVTPVKGRPTPGTYILGVHEVPEIAQQGTGKAQFNAEQLDKREAKREAAATVEAVEELRQAWEKQVVDGIKDRWRKLKQSGERRGTPEFEGQREAAKERELRAKKRWSKVAVRARVKDEEGRERMAQCDAEHSKEQARRQSSCKEEKKRRNEKQEEQHERRREEARREGTEEDGLSHELETEGNAEQEQRCGAPGHLSEPS